MHILNSLRQYTLRSQQNALCRNACSLLSRFYSFFMSAQACVKWQHSPAAYGYHVVYKTRNKTVITGKRHKSWLNDASHLLGSVSHLCNHYTPLHWLRVAIQGHILGTPKRNENWKPARGFNKREFFVLNLYPGINYCTSSTILLVSSVSGSWENRHFSPEKQVCPVWKYLQGKSCMKVKENFQAFFSRGNSMFRPTTTKSSYSCWQFLPWQLELSSLVHGITDLVKLVVVVVPVFLQFSNVN